MSYNPLPQDQNNKVLTRISQHDIYDQIVTASRSNDIVATFISDNGNVLSNMVNITKTGTADATMAAGRALFSSGTGTTNQLSVTSPTSVRYVPGYEIYAAFTAGWSVPTASSSKQLIGIWDITDNGFYIGYIGTNFGIASMNAGVETFINRSAWNGDLLDGSASSAFTRNNVPEAINLSFHNLFRIRYGWYGTAPIIYEVFSPDGTWVVIHTIRAPNSQTAPSITSPNLPISLLISKAASNGTDLTISTSSWIAGTTSTSDISINDFSETTWTSTTPVDTVLETNTASAGSVAVAFYQTGSISAGVVTFERTPDGTIWYPLEVLDNNQTPVIFSTYNLVLGTTMFRISVNGSYQIRARLSTAITGSGTMRIMTRPNQGSVLFNTGVSQPNGNNLHTVVDSGTISIAPVATTGLAPAAATVGTTSVTVVAVNASRKGLILTNTSTNIISLGFSGNTAIINRGVTLVPYGSYMMDSSTFSTGAVTAIASAASSNLAIQEMQ